ncbi:hypothetical protein T484DRAFT_1839128 [Baffinella frigidus]|nr:hypothetical protein T484DRAFT_1839128 [Cryptophyta sp. CCMP2293]
MILDLEDPLRQATGGMLLRLEWCDAGAMRVPLTQCSITPQGGIRCHYGIVCDAGAMRVPLTQCSITPQGGISCHGDPVLIPCSITPQGGIRCHGDPVLIPVYDGELLGAVKSRIARMIGVRDGEDPEDWEFFWFSRERRQSFRCEDDSEELVWNQELLRGFMLMLSREDDDSGPSVSDFVAHAQAAAAQDDEAGPSVADFVAHAQAAAAQAAAAKLPVRY